MSPHPPTPPPPHLCAESWIGYCFFGGTRKRTIGGEGGGGMLIAHCVDFFGWEGQ